MKNSKLDEMLSLLSGKELKKMADLLASPYFNRNESLVQLFDAWQQGIREKAELWALIFPAEEFDDLKFRHLLADLMRLTERFLALQELEERPGMLRASLLRALRRRHADKVYRFTINKFLRKPAYEHSSNDALLERHLLHEEYNAWMESRDLRSGQTNLQPTLESLDSYFLFSKLKYSCTILNNQKVVATSEQNILLDEILQHLAKHSYDHVPAIAIYHAIHAMLSDPESSGHYAQVKELLRLHGPHIQASEARYMYTFALNHCIGHINQGHSEYLREIFHLYQTCLDAGFLFEAGELSPWNFKNIVAVALRLGEFEWTEAFIRGYRDFIPLPLRENAFTYNMARLHFSRREYSQVLRLLQQVEYEDLFYNLDSKVMLLKVYFELEEVEALDSLIDSFRIFLRRSKVLSKRHRRNYLNLIKFVKKLSRLGPGEKAAVEHIAQEVQETGHVADIDWLRQRMAERSGADGQFS